MTLELDRRTLLRGAALSGMAALAVDGLADSAAASSLQGALPADVDVVVVGAGLSGLVAARTIAASGRSVLVVEARDRVGGRLLNHELSGGAVIEAGGAFVGPTQDHILALAAELGVATFPEYVDGKNVYISHLLGQRLRSTYSGTVPPDPTVLLDAALLLQELDSYAKQVSVDAPWTHPKAAQWDSMTLAQYIRSHTVNSSGVTNLIGCWTQPGFGADPDQLSLLFVIHYLACSGNESTPGSFELNANTAGGAQERRFVGGSQLVPLRIAAQLGDQVALAAPAYRIEQGADSALVRTQRGDVRCRQVVVAAPPPLVLDIDWYPQLPARRHALLTNMTMGQLMKCDAVYDRPFWREAGLSGSGVSDAGATRTVFDNSPADGSPGVLLAFVGGSTLRTYGAMSAADRRRHVLEGFAEMFGAQALTPVEYTEHDWTQEPWTRGGPVPIMGPGTMTAFGSSIRVPFGRVHWAGTETSTYWTGYMDGAVRAGQRAGAEVLAAL